MEKENRNIAPINEKENVVTYEIENIRNLIYTIRGKQIMLDSDVAMLYHYTTKNVNKAMKRNIDRFPEDFCFQLTKEELNTMWFQNGTTYENNIKYRSEKYLPYVYTEQGIYMLSGILKNEIAVQVSIYIMRAFIEMRKFIAYNGQIFKRLTSVEYKLLEHDKKFNEVFDEMQKDKSREFKQKIFFNGQIYDAYSLIIDIIKRLNEYGINPQIIDPWVTDEDSYNEYSVHITDMDSVIDVDCIIAAVAHEQFKENGMRKIENLFGGFGKDKVLIDVKGIYEIGQLNRTGISWWRL